MRLLSNDVFKSCFFYPRPVLAFRYCICLHLSVCAFVCVSFCPCINHKFVHPITCDPFNLGSPNLDEWCKTPKWPWVTFKGKSNLKSKFIPFWVPCAFNHQLERFLCLQICAQCNSCMVKVTLQLGRMIQCEEEPLEEPFATDCLMVQLFHYATNFADTCMSFQTLQQHYSDEEYLFCLVKVGWGGVDSIYMCL